MQASEELTAEDPRQNAPQIASWGHFVGFLLIGVGMVSCVDWEYCDGGSGAGTGVWPVSRLSRLEECDRDIRAWSSVWNTRRVAQEFAGERHCPCLGRRLVRMVEVRGLEVETEN